jgi:hypothetical protein
MELNRYPRPARDSRLGIHAGANAFFPMGEVDDDIARVWIPELLAMGFSWVKLLNVEGSAYRSVEELVKVGIEPVIRLYRNEPNPGTLNLQPKTKASVPELVARGVHYFETNNEPNLSCEWINGFIPSYAPEQVAKDFLIDAEYVISCGGIPLIPAMAPGGNWDDMDFLKKMLEWFVRAGRLDVLDKCAIACHNAAFNHPLNYPYDAVNQLGAPVSQEEYDREQWLMTREGINDTRMANKNPGQTLLDSGASNCWLKYQAVHDLTLSVTGLDLPVISTEGGFWRDNRTDNRYPTLTMWGITPAILEVAEQMAKLAPAYYLTTGFWILSNKGMGNPVAAGFENDAWYSFTLDTTNGHLPVVEELKKRGFVQANYQVDIPVAFPVMLTDDEIAYYNKLAGFTSTGLLTSIAVVLAESGGRTNAIGDVDVPRPGDSSGGVFQINTMWHPECYPGGNYNDKSIVFNPIKSAVEAFRISDGGTNWSQWSTFNNGWYLKYLDRAAIAVSLISDPVGPTVDQLRNIAWNSLGIAYNKDFAFPKYADYNNLGLPRSNEVRFNAGGLANDGEYVGQMFDGGFIWCKVGDYSNISWLVN